MFTFIKGAIYKQNCNTFAILTVKYPQILLQFGDKFNLLYLHCINTVLNQTTYDVNFTKIELLKT